MIQELKIIFLDRDGVINRERPDYVKSWSEFEFLPRSLEALRLVALYGCRVIVITNQSVINRRIVTEVELRNIHEKMTAAVAAHGGNIEAVYYCPHVPEDGCDCRKPRPGMVEQAASRFGFDPIESFVVGDAACDMQLGRAVGATTILVRTGDGREREAAGLDADFVADDLDEVAKLIISQAAQRTT